MPDSNPAFLAPVVAAGVEVAFTDTWGQAAKGLDPVVNRFMTRGERQDFETQPHGYLESNPHPERKDRGIDIKSEPIVGKAFDVRSYRFAKRTQWHKDDRKAKSKVQNIYAKASKLGANFARLPWRAMIQMLLSTADPKLMPAIPLTPDGTALFAAPKFGVADGNIVGGSGVSTTAALLTDLFQAHTQARGFLDTKGEILQPDPTSLKNAVIVHGTHLSNVMTQAFKSLLLERTVSATDNPIKAAGFTVELLSLAEFDGTDNWICYFEDDGTSKPFGEVIFDDLTFIQSIEGGGGDFFADTGEEFVQAEAHQGWYANLPTNLLLISQP